VPDLVGIAADAAHDVEGHHAQTGLGGGTRGRRGE
jgi:hypothetical protein